MPVSRQTQTQTQGFIQDSNSFLQQTETEFPVLYISKHNYCCMPVGTDMLRDKLPQQFLLHPHAQASKLTWHASTETCITQSKTVRPTDLQRWRICLGFFLPQLSYWKKKHISSSSSLSIGEKRRRSKHSWVGLGCVSIWPSRAVHVTMCPCPSEGREPAPRKLFQWTFACCLLMMHV